MAVKTHDTNPAISSTQIREILKLENEIDGYLMNHLTDGKALCAVRASSQEVVDEVVKRYKRSGWVIIATPAMEGVWQLKFEDPDQLEITKRLRPVRT
jgi:predicted lactoylglutathione lyase